ncbi:MAG: hypothetical protein Q8J84_02145 [Flavobacteriaceae bacterium]|nr:hypothetical protein [Flavobacteriaceae bacterium]
MTTILINSVSLRHQSIDKSLLIKLFWYHLGFALIYYTYATYYPSDSNQYYAEASEVSLQWMLFFESGTKFVIFLATPIVKLGLSFLATMLIFSWMGYIGFIYAYLFFKENIPIKVRVFGRYDLLTILLFLPNMHFWTASLGKGSIIFMGIMMFVYAVKSPHNRLLILVIGAFFVYMIRPHVMLFVLAGVMIGLLTGKERISPMLKVAMLLSSIIFLYMAQGAILEVANLQDSTNVVEDFETFSSQRSQSLSEASSGVQMSDYPLPLKLLTFWFRPLFFDAPGVLGYFSSLENLLYLLLFAKIMNRRFAGFIMKAPYLVKMAAITFLVSSFAMTFVMANLGIMMRQKSMVMYFGFFVVYYFLALEKYQRIKRYNQHLKTQ